MRILFVENQDSFSWNVIDLLPVERRQIDVVPAHEVCRRPAILGTVDAVVVGPGPTDPERAGLLPLVSAVLARGCPLLGICLGYQLVCLAFGARLVRTHPMHGKVSTVCFRPSRLFPGVRGPMPVMRYHSLTAIDVIPPLTVIATTAEGTPMAVEHQSRPIAGVQFHPDSYATPRGLKIVSAFFRAIR